MARQDIYIYIYIYIYIFEAICVSNSGNIDGKALNQTILPSVKGRLGSLTSVLQLHSEK